MDIQTHSRTAQIKRLSRHLYFVLSAIRFGLYLLWPVIAYCALQPEGTYYLGDTAISIDESNHALKWLILALYSAGLLIMQSINRHFRDLMKQFMNGRIFGQEAIQSVRGALTGGIAFALMSAAQAAIGSIYTYTLSAKVDISFTTGILIAAIYFGLMYTLLWALEIGHDLKDESDMTI